MWVLILQSLKADIKQVLIGQETSKLTLHIQLYPPAVQSLIICGHDSLTNITIKVDLKLHT